MSSVAAFFLGMVQGLTEFLPVSSSGHLVVAQHYLGADGPGLLFEVLVHLATGVAVVAAFGKDVWSLVRKPNQRLTYLIFWGSIPAGVVGLLGKAFFERAFSSLVVVGFMFLLTGTILWIGDSLGRGRRGVEEITYLDALVIGCAQALAILPGVSRSGATIAAALLMGLNRDAAARFSFLLSLVAILGAAAVEFAGAGRWRVSSPYPYLVGFGSSLLFGLLAIVVLLRLLHAGRLRLFSFYTWFVGLAVLLGRVF
ncbi:MAG: undecaprenyl-diphosphate phosphatase [Clostridia bacterium]|nr:undecaprenyl-diphosphate phosphatase [Clostridia bacterium]